MFYCLAFSSGTHTCSKSSHSIYGANIQVPLKIYVYSYINRMPTFHCLSVFHLDHPLGFPTLYSAFIYSFNLSILLSHLASCTLHARHFYNLPRHLPFFVGQPPRDAANMTPNQRTIKIPKRLSLNRIASQESPRSATNARLDGIGYPSTVTSVQNRAVRTSLRGPPNLSPTLHLPPPSPGYTGYPRPQRVYREEFLADPMCRIPPHVIYSDPRCPMVARIPRHVTYSDPRCPEVPQSPQVVDGCELARQEQENLDDIRAGLRSEEVRNREWRNGKAIRTEERDHILTNFRKRKKRGKP